MPRPPLPSLTGSLALFLTLTISLLGSACSSNTRLAPAFVATQELPAQWFARLPHGGQTTQLDDWWAQWQEPLLTELITQAQQNSPSAAAARARLAQAQAQARLAQANLGPSLDGVASASRGVQTTIVGLPVATVGQARAQASWEMDLFGQQQATLAAAQWRAAGSQAAWHAARVSLAAETAVHFFRLRHCVQQRELLLQDQASRMLAERLAADTVRAGLQSGEAGAATRAASAEGAARLAQQDGLCALERKALVALSGVPETRLLAHFSEQNRPFRQYPQAFAATFFVANVPAEALAQRPDLFQAELDVAAAAADLDGANAERYPRLSLTGSVGLLNLRMGSTHTDIGTWSIGPLSLSLPIWNNGRLAANLAGAQARYDEAAASYRSKARQAVREVEEALVLLDAAHARQQELARAAAETTRLLQAQQSRHGAGLLARSELEATRRNQLATQSAVLAQAQEATEAWVQLYRAMGGGWRRPAP